MILESGLMLEVSEVCVIYIVDTVSKIYGLS